MGCPLFYFFRSSEVYHARPVPVRGGPCEPIRLPYLSWTLVFPLGTLILVLLFFFYYWHAQAPRRDSLEWIAMRERRPMTFSAKRYPVGKRMPCPCCW